MLKGTPQLEQLHLEDLIVDNRLPDGETLDDCCVPNLKSLTIVDTRARVNDSDTIIWAGNNNSTALEAYRHLIALNAGKNLKVLDIHYSWEYTNHSQADNDIFSRMHREHAYEYENLEILRLSGLVIWPQMAQRLFETPIRTGKLHTFDIVFPLPTFREAPGQSSADHIQKYQWLEGAESIRCIGIYQFSFKTYVNASDNPLVSFLQEFPCLEELKLASSVSRDYEFSHILEDILNLVKLKSIYTTQLSGASFDKFRLLARNQGVNLIWEKKSPKWPVDFRDD